MVTKMERKKKERTVHRTNITAKVKRKTIHKHGKKSKEGRRRNQVIKKTEA